MILDGNDCCFIGMGIAFNWEATGDLVVLTSLCILVSCSFLFAISETSLLAPSIVVTYTKKMIHSGPIDWKFTSFL